MEGNQAKLQSWLTATRPTFEPRRLPAELTSKTLSRLLCAQLQDYCIGINLYILFYHTSSTDTTKNVGVETNFDLLVARAISINFQSPKQKTHLRPERSRKVRISTLDRVWRICRFSQSVQKKARRSSNRPQLHPATSLHSNHLWQCSCFRPRHIISAFETE